MAAGRIVISEFAPARDRNDALVAGAKMYVYTNGTTTLASIYTSATLVTPLANPVVANSSGQFAQVWADNTLTYTISITGPNGESIGNPSVFDDYSPSTNFAVSEVDEYKAPVRVASTANITIASALINGSTIDGVVVATGDRVLLKDQSTGSQNGIYVVVASGAASRAGDADTSADVTSGMTMFVSEGTANGGATFTLTTANTITLGTTALTFSRVSGPLGAGVAAFLATPSSANLKSAVTDETGSGALVFADAPTLSTIELGHASDTTLARSSAGNVSVEGNLIYRAGGTDVPITDGGTGSSTAADARTALAVVGLTDLAASTGAALVGGIQSGTGAVAETVQATGRRVVYADQYSTPQEAVTAAGSGGTVIFKPGATTTLTTPILTTGLNNIRLVGYGHAMRSGASRINGYINCSGSTNVIIEGFNFDGRMADMPVYTQADWAGGGVAYYYNTPVVADGATAAWSYITVRNCTMTALYTNFVLVAQGTGLTVEGCTVNVPVCTQTYTGTPACQQYSCVYMTTIAGKVSITGNSFLGATITNPALGVNGVYASGITGSLYIADNHAEYCGRNNVGTHRLGVFDIYGDAVNVTIESNTALNTMSQFGRMSATKGGKVSNNIVRWSANAESGYNGFSVEGSIAFSGQKGCQDILVQGNTFDDPSRRNAIAIAVYAYDYGKPSTDIRVLDNEITKATTAIVVAGPYYNVTVRGNSCIDYSTALINVSAAPGGVTLTTTEGTEANGVYDQLFLHDNLGRDLGATGANGIEHSLGTFTTATVGYSEIVGNSLRATGGSGHAIVVLGYSTNTANNRIVIRDNKIVGYGYYTYWRDGGRYVFEGNHCTGMATSDYRDGGGYLGIEYFNNRLSTAGILRGSATLVAGTVTVSNTEIRTGDTVQLTRKSIGGTAGNITLGTITNATSFVINSDNAADTSVVFWEIVH